MTKSNALRARIGDELHLQLLLSLEEADLKPDGLVLVQSESRKIRRQVTTRLAHALGRSVFEIDLVKLAEDHADELAETLEPLVAGTRQFARTDRFWSEHLLAVLHDVG